MSVLPRKRYTCSRGTVLGTRVLACAQGKKLATRRSIAQRGERQNRPSFAGTMNMNVMNLTFTAPCGSAHVCTLFYSFQRGPWRQDATVTRKTKSEKGDRSYASFMAPRHAPRYGTKAGVGSHKFKSCELFLACFFVSSRDAPTFWPRDHEFTTTDLKPSGVRIYVSSRASAVSRRARAPGHRPLGIPTSHTQHGRPVRHVPF